MFFDYKGFKQCRTYLTATVVNKSTLSGNKQVLEDIQ